MSANQTELLPLSPAPASDDQTAGESLALMLSSALAVARRPEADKITNPHAQAAKTLATVFSGDATALTESLTAAATEISGGSLTGIESTLASQAATLDALFHLITRHAFKEPLTPADLSTYLKLALRSQAQSTRALEVLANIKQGPRVVIAGQLNTASQQVVQNCLPAGSSDKNRV